MQKTFSGNVSFEWQTGASYGSLEAAESPKDMPSPLDELLLRAKKFGVRPGFREDFVSFAALTFLERGTTDLIKIRADFYRQYFGDTRTLKGQARAAARHNRIELIEIAAAPTIFEPEFVRKKEVFVFKDYRFTHLQLAEVFVRIKKVPTINVSFSVTKEFIRPKKIYNKTPEWTEYRRLNKIGRFKWK
jgi:hypothetical protein